MAKVIICRYAGSIEAVVVVNEDDADEARTMLEVESKNSDEPVDVDVFDAVSLEEAIDYVRSN